MVTAASMTHAPHVPASGARLFTREGATLPLEASHLEVEAKAGLARTILTQTFTNPHERPLEVTYLLPLPADGAVSGFAFTLAGRRIVGEVDKKKVARERYEAALVAGQTAALLEQERPNTFTQKVGNIPPGAKVVVEVVVDQKLVWISEEGQWSWRFPTVVGPRYMGEPGRVKDAARITIDVADGPLPTKLSLDLIVRDAVVANRVPESPSHPMTTEAEGLGRRVRLDAEAGAALDRDFIVRWPVVAPEVGVSVDAARPTEPGHQGQAYGLLTIVPPEAPKEAAAVPRDLIFLIDTSGSMSGRPLDQAKRVLAAMIDGLASHDRLEMIEFSNRPNRWMREPVVATREGKKAAHKWLSSLQASGGTEMRTGLLEALTPLRNDAQRQVILVTDGYIGFEGEIISTVIEKLPKRCRLHTVGVGSAPNDALLKPAARAGGGVCLALAIDEDPERGAARLVSKTALPLVTNVRIRGDALERTVPMALPDLFAASPAMISVQLSPVGGTLIVEGDTGAGPFSHRVDVAPLALGEGHHAVTALFGREWVEDLEAHRCAGGDLQDIDAQIERVGLDFQIATRKTSWIAIAQDVTVDPELARIETQMPHALPYGMSAEGVGLRLAQAAPAKTMPTRERARVVAPSPASFAPRGFGGGAADDADAVRGLVDQAPALDSLAEADADFEDAFDEGGWEESTPPSEPVDRLARSAPPPPPAPKAAKMADKKRAPEEESIRAQRPSPRREAQEPELGAAEAPKPEAKEAALEAKAELAPMQSLAPEPRRASMSPPVGTPGAPADLAKSKALAPKRRVNPWLVLMGLGAVALIVILLLWLFGGLASS